MLFRSREITYSYNREFISGTSSINKENINLTSDNSKYYKFPIVTEKMIYCEFDTIGRITVYKEDSQDFGIVLHHIQMIIGATYLKIYLFRKIPIVLYLRLLMNIST